MKINKVIQSHLGGLELKIQKKLGEHNQAKTNNRIIRKEIKRK